EAVQFLQALFGEEAPGFLTIFTTKPARTEWFPATDPEAAARFGIDLPRDVYFGVCAQRERLEGGKRGTKDGVIVMPGLWFDLDIKDAAHHQKDLPTSKEAEEFIDCLPHAPTIIVDSGR